MTTHASEDWSQPLMQMSGVASQKKKIIIIAGPTASGKTDLSMYLANAIGGEIISADAMQVYTGMDIGTAKAPEEYQQYVKHHLINVRDVRQPYNVALYCHAFKEAVEAIFAEGKIPIVVGGNGFYIHSIIYGPPKGPPSNPEIREHLENEIEKFGPEMLYQKLKELDPTYASTITVQDRHKIVRSLEIMTLTNKRVSDIPKPSEKDIPQDINFRCWFLFHPKEALYTRIEERCNQMLEMGLLKETEEMLEHGILENPSASASIGYRQAIDYLKSEKTNEDYEKFVKAFKRASKLYAKRQFTWFRKETLFRWLDASKMNTEQILEVMIQDYEKPM